MKSAMRTL